MSNHLDVAKELTLAAIEKMKFYESENSTETHNQMVADEVSKVFKTIYKSVLNPNDKE